VGAEAQHRAWACRSAKWGGECVVGRSPGPPLRLGLEWFLGLLPFRHQACEGGEDTGGRPSHVEHVASGQVPTLEQVADALVHGLPVLCTTPPQRW